jgi:mRNA-degrading endonuclease toxin of MazEF toxin-antitoxin module
VAPFTGGAISALPAGCAVRLTAPATNTTGVVRCDQLRTVDLVARSGRKLESVSDAVMDEVLAKISPIFD